MLRRVLFIHKAANLGGSQNSTYTRMKALRAMGIESESLFHKSGAGLDTFKGFVSYVTSNETKQAEIVQKGNYDLISIINVVPFLRVLRQAGYTGKTLLEVRGRAYLSLGQCPDLKAGDVDAIVVPSLYVQSLVEKVLSDNRIPIHVVPNGIDTDVFKPLQRLPKAMLRLSKPNTRIILWVGRLSDVKNWGEMVNIASVVTKQKPNVEFWVIGDTRVSPGKRAFLSYRKRLGVRQMRLFECIPFRDMPAFYNLVRKRRGCVLSTSISEGLQNSLLEAMACGIPVISSDVGGNLELIQHGKNGFLYESGNPLDGAQRILDLLDDDALWEQMSADGHQCIENYYTMAKHAETFTHIVNHFKAKEITPKPEERMPEPEETMLAPAKATPTFTRAKPAPTKAKPVHVKAKTIPTMVKRVPTKRRPAPVKAAQGTRRPYSIRPKKLPTRSRKPRTRPEAILIWPRRIWTRLDIHKFRPRYRQPLALTRT